MLFWWHCYATAIVAPPPSRRNIPLRPSITRLYAAGRKRNTFGYGKRPCPRITSHHETSILTNSCFSFPFLLAPTHPINCHLPVTATIAISVSCFLAVRYYATVIAAPPPSRGNIPLRPSITQPHATGRKRNTFGYGKRPCPRITSHHETSMLIIFCVSFPFLLASAPQLRPHVQQNAGNQGGQQSCGSFCFVLRE